MERIEHRACFGGWQDVYRHQSQTLNCSMQVGVYLPPQAADGPLPVLYWLSGLTCTEQNFISKAGAQRWRETTIPSLVTGSAMIPVAILVAAPAGTARVGRRASLIASLYVMV